MFSSSYPALGSSFLLQPADTVSPEGSDTRLDCLPPDSIPTATISWTKNFAQLPSNRFRILGNGSLLISVTELSDHAPYHCVATNQVLGLSVTSNGATVYVLGRYNAHITHHTPHTSHNSHIPHTLIYTHHTSHTSHTSHSSHIPHTLSYTPSTHHTSHTSHSSHIHTTHFNKHTHHTSHFTHITQFTHTTHFIIHTKHTSHFTHITQFTHTYHTL